MNPTRIFYLLLILLFSFGCKKEADNDIEEMIPTGWKSNMEGSILYTRKYNLATEQDQIIRVNAFGTKNYTESEQCGLKLYGSDWSPDGRKIAFSDNKGTWIKKIDGSDCSMVDNSFNSYPTWSPYDSLIAFTDSKVIYIFNIDNSWVVERYSIETNPIFLKYLDWSPDGTKIVFQESYIGFGSFTRVVIFGISNGIFSYLDKYTMSPAWSHDGNLLAFTAPDNKNIYQIFISQPDGSMKEQLTHSSSNIWGPLSWSPDGQMIASASSNGIIIYNLEGSPITRINTGGDYCGSVDWH